MHNINKIFLEDEIMTSYLNYAMSVIIGRALPDIRDGLKPVHRRTIYSMLNLKNFSNGTYKKSARIVGDVIGKYHPHGENAVYESIVRLSQSFTQRYVLIDGHGNFGSIDGDPPAAMRYTEIRMTELTEYMIKDLEFFTVDFVDNYDGSEKQPIVLPTWFPNLLINGSYGIAVGMATNIPPHNISEVINACIALIENENLNLKNLMDYISGPDFPTGGLIIGNKGIISAYTTGKGQIIVRSNYIIDKNIEKKNVIVIDELPYQVNKAKLIEDIYSLITLGKINGIKNLRDESDKDGLRLYIELYKDEDPKFILDKLFSLTKLEETFNINMVALLNGSPKVLNLKDIIKYFISYRKEVVYKRTKFKLNKLKKNLHIIEGICIVLSDIEFITSSIVKSNDINELKNILKEKNWSIHERLLKYFKINKNNFDIYKLSENQIKSIIELKISKLLKLEINNIFNDYVSCIEKMINYENILKNEDYLNNIIKSELLIIKNKFGDQRKTKIIHDDDINITSEYEKKNLIITLSHKGYIKIQPLREYKLQNRGGKGKLAFPIKSDDYVQNILLSDNFNFLVCFSSLGKFFFTKLCDLSISTRLAKGIPISNIIKVSNNEKIIKLSSLNLYKNFEYILLVTDMGVIKKLNLLDLQEKKKNGKIIIKLKNGDKLADIKGVNNRDEIMIFSSFGKAIKIKVTEIKCFKRISKGIKGMKLDLNDKIVSLIVITESLNILTVTNNGYGKITSSDKFNVSKRGSKGVLCMRFDKKFIKLVKAERVDNTNDLILITKNGIMSRINIKGIPFIDRLTKGVKLIKLSSNQKLIDISVIGDKL
jgi:DNA gyrase subunit A